MKALVIAEHADAATARSRQAPARLADEVAVAIVGPRGGSREHRRCRLWRSCSRRRAWPTMPNETARVHCYEEQPELVHRRAHAPHQVRRRQARRSSGARAVITDVMSFRGRPGAPSMYFGGVGIVERKAEDPDRLPTPWRPGHLRGRCRLTGSNGEAETARVGRSHRRRAGSFRPIPSRRRAWTCTKAEVVVACGPRFRRG